MKEYLVIFIVGLTGGLLRLLPRGAVLFFGRCLGSVGYAVARRRRITALMNLDVAFGKEMTPGEKKCIARESFENLGRSAVEFLMIPTLGKEEIEERVSFSGEHHLKAALEEGRGVFLLSAHLGNWELFAVAMAMRGYRVAVITKISGSDAVNRVWMGYREDAGIRILKGRGLLRNTMKYLDGGGIVGFVLDQNARRSEGVFVPFFGREACTLKSLAVMARRTGAPVVPAFIYRVGVRHHVVIEEPIKNDMTDDVDTDILRWTENFTAWTERVIRLHPEQWTWLHDRWRTRPREERPTSNVQRKGQRKQKRFENPNHFR